MFFISCPSFWEIITTFKKCLTYLKKHNQVIKLLNLRTHENYICILTLGLLFSFNQFYSSTLIPSVLFRHEYSLM